MQNPKLENGYTRIANEILENIAKTKLNGTQFKIVMVIWRYTYGFCRKEHEFSLSFLSQATDTNKNQIKRELNALIEKNIITVVKDADFNSSRVLSFNKLFEQWSLDKTQGTKKDTVQGAKKDTVQGANPSTKKENIKENIKDIYDYYISLNLIKHRAYTEDMTKAIKSAMKNNKYTIEYCKILLDRHKQVVEITKKEEYPVKARSLTEFFGQKVMNAKHLICAEYEEGGAKYEKYLHKVEEVPKQPFKPKLVFRDL